MAPLHPKWHFFRAVTQFLPKNLLFRVDGKNVQSALVERTRQGHADYRFPRRQGNFRVKHIDDEGLFTVGSIAIRSTRRQLVPIGERGFPTTESTDTAEALTTTFSVGAFPPLVVMTVTRKYGPYHAHLQVKREGGIWKITSPGRI